MTVRTMIEEKRPTPSATLNTSRTKGTSTIMADKAVNDRRDARQQVDGRAKHLIDRLRRHFAEINRKQQTERDADQDGAEGAEDRGQNDRQNAELLLVRLPDRAGQEVDQPDLLNRRDAGHHEVPGDDDHETDGSQTAHSEPGAA